jgi:hypothetical protein
MGNIFFSNTITWGLNYKEQGQYFVNLKYSKSVGKIAQSSEKERII